MIDFFGIHREKGMPFVENGIKEDYGIFALVRHPDGSGLYRFRTSVVPFKTVEANESDFQTINDFKKWALDSNETIHLPEKRNIRLFRRDFEIPTQGISYFGSLVGALIIIVPIAAIAFSIWRLMGWL